MEDLGINYENLLKSSFKINEIENPVKSIKTKKIIRPRQHNFCND